jgi:hypothetical protein
MSSSRSLCDYFLHATPFDGAPSYVGRSWLHFNPWDLRPAVPTGSTGGFACSYKEHPILRNREMAEPVIGS